MDKSSPVPPPEPTVDYKPPAAHRRLLRAVVPLIAVIAIIVLGLIFAGQGGTKKNSSAPAHLILNNQAKDQVILTDASGKQQASASYPKFTYLNFEAASPKGEVLLSEGISTNNEQYLLIVGGKQQALPKAAVKVLSSAIVINNTHRLAFIDENNIVYMTCPDGANCQLMSVDLTSGKTMVLADVGAKSVIPQLPAAYPLGVNPDGKTVYVRTLAANKLGKTAAAVYAVNLSGKVTGNWALPQEADYTPNLSPDAKTVVYKTLGDNSSTKINTLNLETGKTYSAAWTKGALVDQPGVFSWSPDSKKVFFWGSDVIKPRAKADAAFDINLAYLDVSSTEINDLSTVKDSAHNMVAYHGWLDNSDIVYERDSATQAYVFDDKSPQLYKENINSKAVTKLSGPSGSLLQSIFY